MKAGDGGSSVYCLFSFIFFYHRPIHSCQPACAHGAERLVWPLADVPPFKTAVPIAAAPTYGPLGGGRGAYICPGLCAACAWMSGCGRERKDGCVG